MALCVDADGGVALTISAPDSPVSLLRDYAEHCIASRQPAGSAAAMPRRRLQHLSPSARYSSAAPQSPLLCTLPRCVPSLPSVLPCLLYLFCLLLPLLDAVLPFPFVSIASSASSLSASETTGGAAEERWTSLQSAVCSRYTLPMVASSFLFSPLHGVCLTVALWLRLLSWSIAVAAIVGVIWAGRELTCAASRARGGSQSRWRWQAALCCCCYAAFGLVTLLSRTSRRRREDEKRRR
jgi:hypothetical protein